MVTSESSRELRLWSLTTLAMMAFAANSLLCRLALRTTSIDAASFTLVRVLSGAVALGVLSRTSRRASGTVGSWTSAFALMAYATTFSFAYLALPAGIGALLLFGAVQATMIGAGLWKRERLSVLQWTGSFAAMAGLFGLLLPGSSTPPLWASVLMLLAGAAWGIYSLRGRATGDPVHATADNFLRAVPFAVALSVIARIAYGATLDTAGIGYAAASGILASGLGYAIWYAALRGLRATEAAVVQLSVPVLAMVGGIAFLHETPTLRGLVASVAVIGGIAIVILARTAHGSRSTSG